MSPKVYRSDIRLSVAPVGLHGLACAAILRTVKDELLKSLAEDRRSLKVAERRRDKAEEEAVTLRKRIAAVELVLSDVLGIDPAEQLADEQLLASEAAQDAKENPSLAHAVRLLVTRAHDTFTVEQVRVALAKEWPKLVEKFDDASIGGAISRLVRQGVLKVVEPGRGRSAATYAKAVGDSGSEVSENAG